MNARIDPVKPGRGGPSALCGAAKIAMVRRGRRDHETRGPMTESTDLRNYSLRTIVCMVISVAGLLAVPFVGTRWGDFNEMIALIIGVTPILYLVFFAIFNLNQRIAELEKRK
jgi:hypothetical protein